MKLDYSIDPKAQANRYRIEAWFFVPRSLGITPFTYSAEHFYSDTQAYVRFKTPPLSLGGMLKPDNDASPLVRLPPLVDSLLIDPGSEVGRRRFRHEVQLLGCLVRASLRNRVRALRGLIGRAGEAAPVQGEAGHGQAVPGREDVVTGTRLLLDDLRGVLAALRAMRPRVLDPAFPGPSRDIYLAVDEYLSLICDHYLLMLLVELDARLRGVEAVAEVRAGVVARLVAERAHRQASAYASERGDEGALERRVYRMGLLKKLVMNVLFLHLDKERERHSLLDLAAAIAAGVAMLISTLAAIWSQRAWGMNTLPFVMALVVGYMLKDRMKEWLKRYFSTRMARWLPDYDNRIRDPAHDTVVGRCRETFAFVDPARVPPEVLALRRAGARSSIEAGGKPELVMKYVKDVSLRGDVIDTRHGRLQDVNDIIRFNLASFMARMDDPVRGVHVYDPGEDAVRLLPVAKTYHINVVFALSALGATGAGRPPTLCRVRVVAARDGIRRLEELG